MKFTIEADTIEELILGAKSLISCTDGKFTAAETEKPAKPSKSRAKKAEEPAPVAEEVPFVEETATAEAPKAEEASQPEEPAAVEEPKEETKVYSLEDIRNQVKEYTRSGRKDEMKAILKEFGATRSTDLKEDQYAAFMERCNG